MTAFMRRHPRYVRDVGEPSDSMFSTLPRGGHSIEKITDYLWECQVCDTRHWGSSRVAFYVVPCVPIAQGASGMGGHQVPTGQAELPTDSTGVIHRIHRTAHRKKQVVPLPPHRHGVGE